MSRDVTSARAFAPALLALLVGLVLTGCDDEGKSASRRRRLIGCSGIRLFPKTA